MDDISERCQEFLDEYQVLRRRLEEDDFTNPDLDESTDQAATEEDRERLEEVKEILEDECNIELPDEDETDIDIPDYAGGSPSEPMDFDKEE